MIEYIDLYNFIPNDLIEDLTNDFQSKFPLFSEAEIMLINLMTTDEEIVNQIKKTILDEQDAWINAFNIGGVDVGADFPHTINFNSFDYYINDIINEL